VTVLPRSAPTFLVKVIPEGSEAQGIDLSDRVLSFSYEDSDEKADRLILSVDNYDLSNFDDPVFVKGNILEVTWGFAGNTAPPRQVVIEKVTGFQTLNVEGHGLGVLMNKVTKSRVFESVRRSDVVRQIASENGYGPLVQDIDDTQAVLPSVSQAGLTDAAFLRGLADREGFSFFVDFDGLHFHRRRLGQPPIRSLEYFTAPQVGEVVAIRIENDVTAKPGAVTLAGRDPIAKTDILETGSNDTTSRDSLAPVLEVVDPETGATHLESRLASEATQPTSLPTSDLAKTQADGAYRQVQETAVELSATVLGDPSLLAKTVVELRGLGLRLSGNYFVKESKHKIDGSGGYLVELRCLRDGTGATADGAGAPSSGRQNDGSADSSDPDALTPIEAVDQETGQTSIQYRDNRGRGGG
jgi:phage protein D